MARKPAAARGNKGQKKTPPPASPIGHNSGSAESMDDDNQHALFLHHFNKIKALREKLATTNADLRNALKTAKAEGFLKGDFDTATALGKDKAGEIEAQRKREDRIARWLGIPLGTQGELFVAPSQREKAFAEGKNDGIQGKPMKPPYSPGTEGWEGWTEGWHAGQSAAFKIKQSKNPDAPIIKAADEGERDGTGDAFDEDANRSTGDEPDAEWPDDAALAARKVGDKSAEAAAT